MCLTIMPDVLHAKHLILQLAPYPCPWQPVSFLLCTFSSCFCHPLIYYILIDYVYHLFCPSLALNERKHHQGLALGTELSQAPSRVSAHSRHSINTEQMNDEWMSEWVTGWRGKGLVGVVVLSILSNLFKCPFDHEVNQVSNPARSDSKMLSYFLSYLRTFFHCF